MKAIVLQRKLSVCVLFVLLYFSVGSINDIDKEGDLQALVVVRLHCLCFKFSFLNYGCYFYSDDIT